MKKNMHLNLLPCRFLSLEPPFFALALLGSRYFLGPLQKELHSSTDNLSRSSFSYREKGAKSRKSVCTQMKPHTIENTLRKSKAHAARWQQRSTPVPHTSMCTNLKV